MLYLDGFLSSLWLGLAVFLEHTAHHEYFWLTILRVVSSLSLLKQMGSQNIIHG